jgi:hypothetical protein
MSRQDDNHRGESPDGRRNGAVGRYITREQVAAARKRLGRVDRRLGVVDARLETAQRIRL